MSEYQRLLRFVVVAIFALAITAAQAQTTLTTGDLAFTGYSSSGPTTATDQFVFVTLVPLSVGTVIKFTDHGWNSTTLAFFNIGNEANITFTVTPSAIPAGKEIVIVLGPPITATFTNGASAGTVTVAGTISFPSTGDQIFAYQGPDLAPTTFVAGIHMNVEATCGVTTAAGWDPLACLTGTNQSNKPAALTTGTNALWSPTEFDNGKFNGCGLNLSTPALVRAAVNNPANWIFEDQPGGALPSWYPVTWSGCTFLANPLTANSAVSRKTHTGVGDFDIALPLSGSPGIECRSGGGTNDYKVVITFSNGVVSGNASVTTGTGSVSGAPTFSMNTMTVNLTGVTDVQQITVTATSVTDVFAQVLPSVAVPMKVLIGDTNGNSNVNAGDIGQTKAQSGNAAGAGNFRTDVNTSGGISAADIGLVKSKSGNFLP